MVSKYQIHPWPRVFLTMLPKLVNVIFSFWSNIDSLYQLPPTVLALHGCKSRFLWPSILPYGARFTVWAGFYWYGVYELYLLAWWLAMLCFIPLGNGRDQHPRRSKRIRKFGLQGLILVYFHNWRFHRSGSVSPEPPSSKNVSTPNC